MDRRASAGVEEGRSKRKSKGKNKNKSTSTRSSRSEADSKWCAAVHTRLKRFLRSADARVPFELLGPLASREQERFATELCGTVYRVPWRLVTVGKARFVSVSRPASQQQQREVGVATKLAVLVAVDKDAGTAADKQQRGKDLVGLECTERAARQLAARGEVADGDGEEQVGVDVEVEMDLDEEAPLWERDDGNVGLDMLERMGWVQGTGLGKQEQGTVEPLRAVVKNDRAGLGVSPSPAKRAPRRRAKAPQAKGTPPRRASAKSKRDRQQGRDNKHAH